MHVIIGGEKIAVAVSEGGTFHDAATKTISAKTLKGLEKKLREARTPTGNIPVRRDSDGKLGNVTSRVGGRTWRVTYNVRWEDGTISTEGQWGLSKPRIAEEQIQAEALKEASEKASAEHQKAHHAESKFLERFAISNILSTTFPRV